MSSRPSLSIDARFHRDHRDDETPVPRMNSSRRLRTTALHDTQSPADAQAVEAMHQGTAPAGPSPAAPRRHLVFPDPIALKYLEDDDCAQVVQRQAILRGYELYLIEQWACSRKSPTLVIATYTGDERHSIIVGVLAVPANEKDWSTRLRVYLKAADQTHTRPKTTELGELMITNLSCFPSSLTAIPVPNGDLLPHRHIFIVNEDLKRLGCSGRSGLTLTEPTEATQAKFQQLYKTSKDIPFTRSVTELVKLCQVALCMFHELDHEYIDGLLCDATETAIRNWWADIGGEHYNYEAADGVLGPSTVAALLGLFMGARNRLHWQGAPVPKDVFDIEGTKRGIAHFQKGQKLEKTRRLDQQTFFRLVTVTTKAAAKEGWGVQKAVKSTMTEIGGKRGEIMLDMVAGKDKGGLADIETLDMDKFVSLVYGERPKWLWYGKPRRTPLDSPGHDLNGETPVKGEPPSQAMKRTQSPPSDDEQREGKRKEEPLSPDAATAPSTSSRIAAGSSDGPGEKDPLRKTVFKSVAEKMSDARSGLGRIKDAVGARGRGHAGRLSLSAAREEGIEASNGSAQAAPASTTSATSPVMVNRVFTWKTKPDEYLAAFRRGDPYVLPGEPSSFSNPPSTNNNNSLQIGRAMGAEDRQGPRDGAAELRSGGTSPIARQFAHRRMSSTPSATGEALPDLDLAQLDHGPTRPSMRQLALGRRHSLDLADLAPAPRRPNENRWPRRLSFSDAEQAILTWDEIISVDLDMDVVSADAAGAAAAADPEARAIAASRLSHHIASIVRDVEPWVSAKLDLVKLLGEQYARDRADLHNLYHHLGEACRHVQSNSDEILADGRAALAESIREIELLVARLEYETTALAQRVHDVEDGVLIFQGQVEDVERRAEELKTQLETESWLHWFVRTLTGVGTGPNVTRSVP